MLDDQERPTAWPWLRQLKGETIHAGEEDLINIDHRATLNDALDTMLTNSHGGAVVTGDRDRYLGVVDFAAVTDFMRVQQEQLEADVGQRGARGVQPAGRARGRGHRRRRVRA